MFHATMTSMQGRCPSVKQRKLAWPNRVYSRPCRLVSRAAMKKPDDDETSPAPTSAKGRALGCALACLLTLQPGLDVVNSVAQADDLSAYERRKQENERRKELLRNLREKAENGASSVAPTPPPAPAPTYTPTMPTVPTIPKDTPKVAPPPAPKDELPKLPSLPSFSAPSLPSFSAPKLDVPKMPSFGGSGSESEMPKLPSLPSFSAPSLPSFSGPSDDSSKAAPVPAAPKPVVPPPRPVAPVPKPSPPPPPPAPKPLPPPTQTFKRPNVVMPDSAPKSSQGDTLDQWRQQQRKDLAARQKREAQTAKKNKSRNQKRGGMPTWLAEFFLLAMFGGFAFAIVALPEVISGLYRKVDSFLLGLFQKK